MADRRGLRALPACAALAAFAQVHAESPNDRYWAQLEYFLPKIESSARLDASENGPAGTRLGMEDDLGLRDRKGTPYLLLGTRLGERWRVEFEYYRLRRSASTTLGRDVQWGDRTFSRATALDSEFNSTVYRLVAGWSFLRSETAEAGVALGLHATDFELALAGQAAGTSTASGADRRDQFVPLPTVGLYGSYVFAPNWTLRGRFDYLSLSSEDYDGRLTNWLAAVDWRFANNWSVGLGWRFVNYKLDLSKPRFDGELNYRFRGPTVFLSAAF